MKSINKQKEDIKELEEQIKSNSKRMLEAEAIILLQKAQIEYYEQLRKQEEL